MKSTNELLILRERVLCLAAFLENYERLTNCHNVEFITQDLYMSLIPKEHQQQLDGLSEAELVQLPISSGSGNVDCKDEQGCSNALVDYVASCQANRLEHILDGTGYLRRPSVSEDGSILGFESEGSAVNSHSMRYFPFKNFYTTDKKNHEVKILALTVDYLAKNAGIKQIIDIGSGKGYLGTALALCHGLDVIGLDCSSSNSLSAQQRLVNLKKHWFGNRLAASDTNGLSNSTGSTPHPDGATGCHYISITQTMGQDCNLDDLLASSSPLPDISQGSPPVLVCGLHTCGDLAAATIKAFIASKRCRWMVLVGCCYHLIEEEFNVIQKKSNPEAGFSFGFPLSNILKEKQISIGRNARMLAAQPVHRIVAEQRMPDRSLFWRALLEQIVVDHKGQPIPQSSNVGRIAQKCSDFAEYVERAVNKLNMSEIQLSSAAVDDYLRKYSSSERKLQQFFQYRCCLAPSIEAIIVLDRLIFLLEQESIMDAFISPLFDPSKSPRHYALIVEKKDL